MLSSPPPAPVVPATTAAVVQQRLDALVATDLATGRPMRVDDRFRIASLTKTFAAMVVMQLVDEGRLSPDDTVERWLPGVVPNGAAITVRQLLGHQSGLASRRARGSPTAPPATSPWG